MDILTDFPERLRVGKTVFAGDDHLPLKISSIRKITGGGLIAFEGYDDYEAVEALRNKVLYVRSTDLPVLPNGEYYFHQIIGLTAIGEDGTAIGVVVEILETGANDVYIVRKEDGGEILLPDIESVIRQVDLKARTITVRLPEWYS